MGETPEYTKRAIQTYNKKFDRVAVNLPKGSKERIKQLTGGISCNAFINVLVREKLEELENAAKESNDFMNPPEESKKPKENSDLPDCFK